MSWRAGNALFWHWASNSARRDSPISPCAKAGIYTILDLHALPGYQNQHWHSDNPTHWAHSCTHRHFQDRVVNLWEALADRNKGNPWVAGYNPVNEPACARANTRGPPSQRGRISYEGAAGLRSLRAGQEGQPERRCRLAGHRVRVL